VVSITGHFRLCAGDPSLYPLFDLLGRGRHTR
jgi:hypothetical protein